MKTRLLQVISFLLLLIANNVHAHKVNMFTYAEGEEIYVEGYFTDGKAAMNSEVMVYDSSGNELWKGNTDEEGQLSFPIPAQVDLRIVLRADQGHQTEYTLSMAEITGVEETESTSATGDHSEQSEITAGTSTAMNQKGLEHTVEKAVGKAIRPVMRSIDELKESKSLSDILGGIGFIFGIMGIFFYMKARKENNKD